MIAASPPGVKFADADLIGIPLRLTVSKKALANGGIEAKWRDRARPRRSCRWMM